MMVMFLVGKKVYEEIFIFTSDGASGFPGCRNHPQKKKTVRADRFEEDVPLNDEYDKLILIIKIIKEDFIYG